MISKKKNGNLRNPFYAIFNNGILLRNEEETPSYEIHFFKLSRGCYNINILHNQGNDINIARTQILDSANQWQIHIKKALTKYFINEILEPLFLESIHDRWYHIGQKIGVYPIEPEMVISNISNNYIPIITLDSGGKISFEEIGNIHDDILYAIPEELLDDIIFLFQKECLFKEKYNGFLQNWTKMKCYGFSLHNPHLSEFFPSILNAYNFSASVLQKKYRCTDILFIDLNINKYAPLSQFVCHKINNEFEILPYPGLMEKALNTPELLNNNEIETIYRKERLFQYIPPIFNFLDDNSQYFSFGLNYINANHPLTTILLQILVSNYLNSHSGSKEISFYQIIDKFKKLYRIDRYNKNPVSKSIELIKEILDIAIELNLPQYNQNYSSLILNDLFVPNSFNERYRFNNK